MPELTIATLRLEGFPTPDGRIRAVLHSATGQQELFVTLAEWSALSRIEHTLDAAGRLITELQQQRDQAVADFTRLDELHRAEILGLDYDRAKLKQRVAELEATQAAFVETMQPKDELYFVRYELNGRTHRAGPWQWNEAITHRNDIANNVEGIACVEMEEASHG